MYLSPVKFGLSAASHSQFTLRVSGVKASTRAGSSKSFTSLILSAVPGSMNDEITCSKGVLYPPKTNEKNKSETIHGGHKFTTT